MTRAAFSCIRLSDSRYRDRARPATARNAQTALRRSIPFASKNPVNLQQEFRRRNAA